MHLSKSLFTFMKFKYNFYKNLSSKPNLHLTFSIRTIENGNSTVEAALMHVWPNRHPKVLCICTVAKSMAKKNNKTVETKYLAIKA